MHYVDLSTPPNELTNIPQNFLQYSRKLSSCMRLRRQHNIDEYHLIEHPLSPNRRLKYLQQSLGGQS